MNPAQPVRDRVTRKLLDEDCLLDGELHPSIAERLKRVQELPVAGVAHLRGVDRDAEGVWLIWQYIDGVTLEEFLKRQHMPEELAEVLQQIKLKMAAMHSHGIVHGAIHERNVIIDASRRVHLTHVSPLLYDDLRRDEQAVAELIQRIQPTPNESSSTPDSTLQYGDRLRIALYAAAAIAVVAGVLIFAAILRYIRA